MRRRLFCLFFVLCSLFYGTSSPLFALNANSSLPTSLVFVHLGNELPSYLPIAVAQARLFNPDVPIYLIAESDAYERLKSEFASSHIQFVSHLSLKPSISHHKFKKRANLDKKGRKDLFYYAIERFFYIEELIAQHGLLNVFHLEGDVMLYASLQEMLPLFVERYKGIAAAFDNDERVIPSFMYIKSSESMEKLTHFLCIRVVAKLTDMKMIAEFKKEKDGSFIDHLPILPPLYCSYYPLISPAGYKGANAKDYFKNFDVFQGVFDAAAIGQYLGGIDSRNDPNAAPGFINESCVFNPSYFYYEWKLDEKGRYVPFATFNGITFRVYNLHIHCKKLAPFYSLSR